MHLSCPIKGCQMVCMRAIALNTHLRLGHQIKDSYVRRYYVEVSAQQLLSNTPILYTPQVSISSIEEEEVAIALLMLDAERNVTNLD